MGRNIKDLPNVQPPDGDFIYGRLKDDDGTDNGTPMKESTMGDIWMFFARMLDQASIVSNGLPDNAYNGFQFFESLIAVINLTIISARPKRLVYINDYLGAVKTGQQTVATLTTPNDGISRNYKVKAYLEIDIVSTGSSSAFGVGTNILEVKTPSVSLSTSQWIINAQGLSHQKISQVLEYETTVPIGPNVVVTFQSDATNSNGDQGIWNNAYFVLEEIQ